MTIEELQIEFDLRPESKTEILKNVAKFYNRQYFFVDSKTGFCYLFDEYGNPNDINKIIYLNSRHIRTDIKKIVIPNGVTNIGVGAFDSCSKLINVTIPDSVESIGDWAFYDCHSLTSVTIPDNVMSIGADTFEDCHGLTSITIPNNVTSIGEWAFEGCNNLKSLILKGKTIDEVKAMTFYPWGIEDESTIKC